MHIGPLMDPHFTPAPSVLAAVFFTPYVKIAWDGTGMVTWTK